MKNKEKYKISLVIPVLNKEPGLESVLKNIPQELISEVIIVHQKSKYKKNNINAKDDTTELAKKYKAKVINDNGIGYGKAYKVGFNYTNGNIITTLDGDGTYDPKDIEKMLKCLKENNADFISGNRLRNLKKESMPKKYIYGNYLISLIFNILFFTSIYDSQSGMWLFKKELLKKIELKENQMGFSSEIKWKIYKKFKFREIPISYKPRQGEKSLNLIEHGLQVLKSFLKMRFFD